MSVDSAGAEGSSWSAIRLPASISDDGRYVVFLSDAPDLVIGDTNGLRDIFVRDRLLGTTERVSVDSAGVQANGHSGEASISADGRFVAFGSNASNLVAGDANGLSDAFVRDRQTGTTERVSVDSVGVEGNGGSGDDSSISADGRYVSFRSSASNLVPGDTNNQTDVFVRDRQLGTTERVSVDSAGVEGDGVCLDSMISADGRYVVFQSASSNLVPGDTNGVGDIFVRDLVLDTTERVSVDSMGAEANGVSHSPSISALGRYVAFQSSASNLVPGDTNAVTDVFVHDRQTGTTERVSLDSVGTQGDDHSYNPSISADGGRYVAFLSLATNLVPGDTNATYDVFVHDRQLGTTERISVDSAGNEANDQNYGEACSISADGMFVAFNSDATNLVVGDTNGTRDVFVREPVGVPAFTSLCFAGTGGVIACPCSNPPAGPGQGCDNSSATGGAVLAASGGAYLSSDSLVFTTSGERPTALSIVSQWTGTSSTGLFFGQGVRCTSGTFKRLYTKAAVAGSITAPDYGAGDLQVSIRSAALGDVLAAGQSRWHFVYYRDPMVLGGCSPLSTFNCTQTGMVTWSP